MRPHLLGAAMAGVMMLPGSVRAGGYSLDEQDAAATGRGGTAGARVGPSAAYFNPAGLLDQGLVSAEVGGTLLAPAVSAVDPSTGKSTAAAAQLFVPPYAYVAHSQGDVSYGLALNAPFGLGVSWPTTFPGRFEIQSASIQALSIEAALSYRIVPALSVGVAAGAVHSQLDVVKALDFVNQEGSTHVLASGWGFAATAGARYAVSDVLQLGFSGAIPSPIAMSGVARFSNVPDTFAPLTPDQNLTTRTTLPARLRLGASVHPLVPLRLDADVEVTFWSAFKSLDLHFANPSTPEADQAKDWHDTLTARLGAEYEWPGIAVLRAGALYDQAASPVSTMTPDAPDGDRFGFTLGVGRELVRGLRADLAYGFLAIASRTSADPFFRPRYSGDAQVVGLSVTYQWLPAAPPMTPAAAPPPPPPAR
jgi:long-chain fatty acid transport protein